MCSDIKFNTIPPPWSETDRDGFWSYSVRLSR